MKRIFSFLFLLISAYSFAQSRYEEALAKPDILYTQSRKEISEISAAESNWLSFANRTMTVVSSGATYRALEINKKYYLDWDEVTLFLNAIKYFSSHQGVSASILARNGKLLFRSTTSEGVIEIVCGGTSYFESLEEIQIILESALKGEVYIPKNRRSTTPAPSVEEILERIE